MALVKMTELLKNAVADNKAIGAFNVSSMEMIIGAVKAAEESTTPIMLQIAQVRLKYSPFYLIAPLMLAAAKQARVPIAVHLDHGQTFKAIQIALDAGFTSVMFDGSLFSLEENIKKTHAVLQLARRYNAAVEAELGIIGGSEDGTSPHTVQTTEPDSVAAFLAAAPVDALAVAIGNTHGHYKGVPHLAFDVLKTIAALTKIPLVLHGGSGISDADFRKSINFGVRKINIATANFDALVHSSQAYFAAAGNTANYFDLNEAVVQAVYENVKHHIIIFNNKNPL